MQLTLPGFEAVAARQWARDWIETWYGVGWAGVSWKFGKIMLVASLIDAWEGTVAGKKTTAAAAAAKAPWKGFVRLELTEQQWQAFEAWDWDAIDAIGYLFSITPDGFKFGVSGRDDGSYSATLTADHRAGDLAGWCLSAFSEDAMDAARILAFKHLHVCDGKWPIAGDGPQRPRRG